MSVGLTRALVLAVATAGLAMSLTAVLLLALGGTGQLLSTNTVGGFVLGLAYPLLGGLIAWRRPGHTMGWVFLGIGLSQALDTLATEYAQYGLLVRPGSLPFAAEASWLGIWSWAPGFTLFVVFSILLFPSGSLPSPRWRPVAYLAVGATLLLVLPVAVAGWPLRGIALIRAQPSPGLSDPVSVAMLLQMIGILLVSVAALASLGALVLRFRRAGAAARQQLKWFTYAGTLEIGAILITDFVTLPGIAQVVVPLLAVPLLPVATAIAILRHKLFDIDLFINRTLVYGTLTVVLGAIYGVAVLIISALLGSLASGNSVAVAIATLLVAALLVPLRHRIQAVVDRRFYRARYDAALTVASFNRRLRDEVELDPLTQALTQAVEMTMRPSSVSIWLRRGTQDLP